MNKIDKISEMSFDECLDALKNLHEFTLLRQIWSGDNTPVMDGMCRIAGELADRIDELRNDALSLGRIKLFRHGVENFENTEEYKNYYKDNKIDL